MKCPKCNANIPKYAEFCEACGYKVVAADTKEAGEKKKKNPLAIIIPAAVVLIAIVVTLIIILPTSSVVASIDCDSEVQHNEPVTIVVTAVSEGYLKSSMDTDVYIDGNAEQTLTFDFDGSETKTLEFDVETANAYDSGTHTITVADLDATFTVLKPASFVIELDESDQRIFTVGETYTVNYTLKNVGESTGEYGYEVSFPDQPSLFEAVKLKGGESYAGEAKVASDAAGTYDLTISDAAFPITFYEVSEVKNGEKLMENTVKGYGYFLIINNSENDMVVYITEADDTTTAVSAVIVAAGNEVKLYSFPHGSYYLFVQTGKGWVEELTAFAPEQTITQLNDELVFENNVDKHYGGWYTYWTINLYDDLETSAHFTEVDQAPSLVLE